MFENLKKSLIGDLEENTEEEKGVSTPKDRNDSMKKSPILCFIIIIVGVLIFAFYTWQNHQKLDCLQQCLADIESSHNIGILGASGEIEQREACENFCKNKSYSIFTFKEDLLSPESKTTTPDPTVISLQQVSNVGYTFYLGQIDYKDTQLISDDVKNNITQIIYRANFPRKLLDNVGIIIVNTLAVSEYKYIETPNGNVSIPSFSPDFLTGGGIYSGNFGQMSFIFINKTKLGSLSDILTHELGHYIGNQLTTAEWTKYYQLRGISVTTSRRGQSWTLSPEEDFAEVYKSIFTGLEVRTNYGLLEPYLFLEHTCDEIYDRLVDNYKKAKYPNASPWDIHLLTAEEEASISFNTELQNCRREVLSHPEKYPEDWQLGVPYKSGKVDQATKTFVAGVIARLNQ